MIAKIVTLFLVIIAVLAMIGKLRVPGSKTLEKLRARTRLDAQKCPKCGSYKIGKSPCACRKGSG